MNTNSNLSNSNIQIYAGILPVMDYHQEIIGQLPNPAVILPATIVNCCWMESIAKRRLRSDFLAEGDLFK